MMNFNKCSLAKYITLAFVIFLLSLNTSAVIASQDSTKTFNGIEARQILTDWANTRKPSEWSQAINRIAYAQLQALGQERKIGSMTIKSLPVDPQNVESYSLVEVSIVLDEGCSLVTLQTQILLPDNKKSISFTSMFKEVNQEVICTTSPRMGTGN